ncbi:hypothetical protein MNBD_NITROSPINAE01-899 [hydrothermal vent metagenome]|uniref:ATP-grasp domain-containing protein n=1 Tax=hydrothermal vent metagenome TaxID=652676 RepID=A0A3B1C0M1_9ZZZZ
MKVFIYESVSCEEQSESPLIKEGRAMLDSVTRDFEATGIVDILTATHNTFSTALEKCDAALIIAPETNGKLEKLTCAVIDSGKVNLGCTHTAIKVTGDKFLFSKIMQENAIPHPKTFMADDIQNLQGRCVIKPVDGAGSENITLCNPGDYTGETKNMIAQECVEGEPMSLSIISDEKTFKILSVNRQFLTDEMQYTGGEIVNTLPSAKLYSLTEKIKNAIAGLSGYWGIDFVQTKDGPVVIEVNPRITTSYCALSAHLQINPAKLILNMQGIGVAGE